MNGLGDNLYVFGATVRTKLLHGLLVDLTKVE